LQCSCPLHKLLPCLYIAPVFFLVKHILDNFRKLDLAVCGKLSNPDKHIRRMRRLFLYGEIACEMGH